MKKILIHFRSEYGAFWKCVTAGAIYMITQLAKMIFLATVFPVPLDEDDDDPNAEIPFDFLMVSTKSLYISDTESYLSITINATQYSDVI